MPAEVPVGGTIEAAGRGETWAVEEIAALFRQFARHVCAGAGRSGCAPELGWEDVAQEASRRFFASGVHQYRGVGREGSYLYSIVKTTWIDVARSSYRRRQREEVTVMDQEFTTSPTVAIRVKVHGILSRLAEGCRELLEHVFLDGKSYQDLSDSTGLAESSLRAKVSRCIRRARELSA